MHALYSRMHAYMHMHTHACTHARKHTRVLLLRADFHPSCWQHRTPCAQHTLLAASAAKVNSAPPRPTLTSPLFAPQMLILSLRLLARLHRTHAPQAMPWSLQAQLLSPLIHCARAAMATNTRLARTMAAALARRPRALPLRAALAKAVTAATGPAALAAGGGGGSAAAQDVPAGARAALAIPGAGGAGLALGAGGAVVSTMATGDAQAAGLRPLVAGGGAGGRRRRGLDTQLQAPAPADVAAAASPGTQAGAPLMVPYPQPQQVLLPPQDPAQQQQARPAGNATPLQSPFASGGAAFAAATAAAAGMAAATAPLPQLRPHSPALRPGAPAAGALDLG